MILQWIKKKIFKGCEFSIMEHLNYKKVNENVNENELKRNGSGYYDPTAWRAIKNAEKDSKEEYERLQKLLGAIHRVCELAGYHVEGRITLVNEKTGKVWR